jgi:hypothetical protein
VTSLDSIDWFGRAADIPDILLWSVTFGNGEFLTAGSNSVFISRDGSTWTGIQMPTDDYLIATAYGEGNYVAVGTRGTIFSSANGSTWIDRSLDESIGDFYSVSFGNGIFVAVSIRTTEQLQESVILTSFDGSTWNVAKEYPLPVWYITYGNGLFIAVGDSGTILSSSDGSTWEHQSTGTTARLTSAEWGAGTFVVVGEGGTILISVDGCMWNDHSPETGKELYSVVCGADQFMAIGDEGSVYVSLFDNSVANSVGGTLSKSKKIIDFHVSGTKVRFSLSEDFTHAPIDAALFTIAGKKIFSTRIDLSGSAAHQTSFHCAPGRYLMTVAGEGKQRLSMPVTVMQ